METNEFIPESRQALNRTPPLRHLVVQVVQVNGS